MQNQSDLPFDIAAISRGRRKIRDADGQYERLSEVAHPASAANGDRDGVSSLVALAGGTHGPRRQKGSGS